MISIIRWNRTRGARLGLTLAASLLAQAHPLAAAEVDAIANETTPRRVEDLLAPARILTDVLLRQPAKLSLERAGETAFRLSGELPANQATVHLVPASGAWDVSAYSFVRIDFVNRGTGLVWILGRLDNEGALDWANSARSQAFVLPGERATLGFPFPRAKALDDTPSLFATQSAKPNGHRDHWMKFDPAKVIACRLAIQSSAATLDLSDFTVSLAFPYGAEANKAQLEFPYLDSFGQVRALDWPGKLHDEAELRRRHAAELAAAAGDKGPVSFGKFGGWVGGPRLKATGFFRTEKVDGKWWLVDPEGLLFFSHGANSVGFAQSTQIKGRESLFAWLPDADDSLMKGAVQDGMINFMAVNLARTFGPGWQQPARERIHQRMRTWGMNTIGAWSDQGLTEDKRTPFTPILHLGGGYSPLGNKIVDPFVPGFKADVVARLRKLVPDRDNPWVLGVFIDNEIYWHLPYVQNAFLRGPAQPARIACVDWLREKHGTIESLNSAWATSYKSWEEIVDLPKADQATAAFKADLSELRRLIAGTYYRICHEAMREALPNHLYLGSRFHKADDEVYEQMAKYLDVVSGNSYETVAGTKASKTSDKPCMETEFHFGAPDRGVPGVGLWSVGDQTQRARGYVAYVLSALNHPNVVGTHWFAFPDQSAAARRISHGGSSGENYQIGFVDVTDTPYPEIAAAARTLADHMYALRSGQSPGLLEALEALWREPGAASGKRAP